MGYYEVKYTDKSGKTKTTSGHDRAKVEQRVADRGGTIIAGKHVSTSSSATAPERAGIITATTSTSRKDMGSTVTYHKKTPTPKSKPTPPPEPEPTPIPKSTKPDIPFGVSNILSPHLQRVVKTGPQPTSEQIAIMEKAKSAPKVYDQRGAIEWAKKQISTTSTQPTGPAQMTALEKMLTRQGEKGTELAQKLQDIRIKRTKTDTTQYDVRQEGDLTYTYIKPVHPEGFVGPVYTPPPKIEYKGVDVSMLDKSVINQMVQNNYSAQKARDVVKMYTTETTTRPEWKNIQPDANKLMQSIGKGKIIPSSQLPPGLPNDLNQEERRLAMGGQFKTAMDSYNRRKNKERSDKYGKQYTMVSDDVAGLVNAYNSAEPGSNDQLEYFGALQNIFQRADEASFYTGQPMLTTGDKNLDAKIRTRYVENIATSGISQTQWDSMAQTIEKIKNSSSNSKWTIDGKTYKRDDAVAFLEDQMKIEMPTVSGTATFIPGQTSYSDFQKQVGQHYTQNVSSQLIKPDYVTSQQWSNIVNDFNKGYIGLSGVNNRIIDIQLTDMLNKSPLYKGIGMDNTYKDIMRGVVLGTKSYDTAQKELDKAMINALQSSSTVDIKKWEKKVPMFVNPEINTKYENYKKAWDVANINVNTPTYATYSPSYRTKYGLSSDNAREWLKENPTPNEYKQNLINEYKSNNKYLVNFDTLKSKTHERALELKIDKTGTTIPEIIGTTMEYERADREEWEFLGEKYGPGAQAIKTLLVGFTQFPRTIYTAFTGDVEGLEQELYQAGYGFERAKAKGYRGEGWGDYAGKVAFSPAMTDVVYPFVGGYAFGAALGGLSKAGQATGAVISKTGGKTITLGSRVITIGGKTVVEGGTKLGRAALWGAKYAPYTFTPFIAQMGYEKYQVGTKYGWGSQEFRKGMAQTGLQLGMMGLGGRAGAQRFGPKQVPRTITTKEQIPDPYGFKRMSPVEAKATYRKLSLRLHPDKPTGSIRAFQALKASYQAYGMQQPGILSRTMPAARTKLSALGTKVKTGIRFGGAQETGLTVWKPQTSYRIAFSKPTTVTSELTTGKATPKSIQKRIDSLLAQDRALQTSVMKGEISRTEFQRLIKPIHEEWSKLVMEKEILTSVMKPKEIMIHGTKLRVPPGTKPGVPTIPRTLALGKEALPPGQYPTISREPTFPSATDLYKPKTFRIPTQQEIQIAQKAYQKTIKTSAKEQARLGRLPRLGEQPEIPTSLKLSELKSRIAGRTDLAGAVGDKFKFPRMFKPKPVKTVYRPSLEKVPVEEIPTSALEKGIGRMARVKSKTETIELVRDKWGKVKEVKAIEEPTYPTIEEKPDIAKQFIEEIRPWGDKEVTPKQYAKLTGIKTIRPPKSKVIRSRFGRGIAWEGQTNALGFTPKGPEGAWLVTSPYLPRTKLTQRIFTRTDIRRTARAVFEDVKGRTPTTKELNDFVKKIKTDIGKSKLLVEEKVPLQREVLIHELLHRKYPGVSEAKIEALTADLIGIRKPFVARKPGLIKRPTTQQTITEALENFMGRKLSSKAKGYTITEITNPNVLKNSFSKNKLDKLIKNYMKKNTHLTKKQAETELLNKLGTDVRKTLTVQIQRAGGWQDINKPLSDISQMYGQQFYLETMRQLPRAPLQLETPVTERMPYMATGRFRPRIEALAKGERGIDFRMRETEPMVFGKVKTIEDIVAGRAKMLEPTMKLRGEETTVLKETNTELMTKQITTMNEILKSKGQEGITITPELLERGYYPARREMIQAYTDNTIKDAMYVKDIGIYVKTNINNFIQRKGNDFLKGSGSLVKVIPEILQPDQTVTKTVGEWLTLYKQPLKGLLNKPVNQLIRTGKLKLLGRINLNKYGHMTLKDVPMPLRYGDTLDVAKISVREVSATRQPSTTLYNLGTTHNVKFNLENMLALNVLSKNDAKALINTLGLKNTYPNMTSKQIAKALLTEILQRKLQPYSQARRTAVTDTMQARKFFDISIKPRPPTSELIAEQRDIALGKVKPTRPGMKQPYKIVTDEGLAVRGPEYYKAYSQIYGKYPAKIKSYAEMVEGRPYTEKGKILTKGGKMADLGGTLKSDYYGQMYGQVSPGTPSNAYSLFKVKNELIGKGEISGLGKGAQQYINQFMKDFTKPPQILVPEIGKVKTPVMPKTKQGKMLVAGEKGLQQYQFEKTAKGLQLKYKPTKPVEPIMNQSTVQKIISSESTAKTAKAVYKLTGVSKEEFELAYKRAMREIQVNKTVEREINATLNRVGPRQAPTQVGRVIVKNISREGVKLVEKQMGRVLSRQIEAQIERQIERQISKPISRYINKVIPEQIERQITRTIPRIVPTITPKETPIVIPPIIPTATKPVRQPSRPYKPKPPRIVPPKLPATEKKEEPKMKYYGWWRKKYKEREFILPTFTGALQQKRLQPKISTRFKPTLKRRPPKTLKL